MYSSSNSGYLGCNTSCTNTTDTAYLCLFPSDYHIWGFLLVALLLEVFCGKEYTTKLRYFIIFISAIAAGYTLKLSVLQTAFLGFFTGALAHMVLPLVNRYKEKLYAHRQRNH